MAIGFRAVGSRLKIDLAQTTNGNQVVQYPAGHAAGDLLLMFVVTDGNNNVTTDPAGWTRLAYITQGSATSSPYTPSSRLKVFYRIDDGTLGSSITLPFNVKDAWPTGKYEVLAFIAAYTGVDPSAPIGEWFWQTTTSTSAALALHQFTSLTRAGDWLLSFRAIASDAPAATFTNSVGTDVERVDDSDTINELACALYDSNTALAAGSQTQRTITASRAATYGSTAISIALQPPAPVNTATANAQTAEVVGTAGDASPTAVNGPWSLCDPLGLPRYRVQVDWAGDGSYTDSTGRGTVYVADTFSRAVTGGWGSASTGQPWTSSGGSASDFSVNGGAGLIALSTRNVSRYAVAPSPSADTDQQITFAVDQAPAADSFFQYLQARHLDTSNSYAARVQIAPGGAMTLTLRKRVASSSDTQLASYLTALTHAVGAQYTLRLRVVGSTLWAKVWLTGTAEPAWQLTVTDTDLTAAGNNGVRTLINPSTTNTLPVTFSYTGYQSAQPLDSDDITSKVTSDISISYGRDQQRQLNPAAVGSASFTLNNSDRTYSPDVFSSVLYGDLEPARLAQASVSFGGRVYPLMKAKIDDYNIKADRNDRTVDFTFLDGLADLQNVKLSTGVCKSQRVGALINTILDFAGFTGPRDIDLGASVVPYWWVEGTDALAAITDLVKSEGPPAIFYQAPDGTMVFRDRHHRLLRSQSTTAQAVFAQSTLMDCQAPAMPPGSYDFTAPFAYAHGWRDIVNSVSFDVAERLESAYLTPVWTSDSTIAISQGQSVQVSVSTSDPFMDAVVPQPGADYFTSGPGTPLITLDRTSGQSATLTLLAVNGPVSVTQLQLRAKTISVQRTVKVERSDSDSITRHGRKDYPETAPWASVNDADAIAGMILLHYARRRPTIQLRIVSQDPSHWVQAITRTVSDRIRVRYDEMGINDDFFVEKVTHTIRRYNQAGLAPVHEVVLGCEKDLAGADNPFTFDLRGSGFDQGVFDYIQTDKPSSVFIFDHPTQGQFDVGLYGT